MELIRRVFSTPGRQAAAWAGIGIIGLGLAAIGLLLLNRNSGGPQRAGVAALASPTATAQATATASPSPSPTPGTAPFLTATPAATTGAQTNGDAGANTDAAPAATEPAAAPTPPAAVAGGPYCSNVSSTSPPNSVIGLLTAGGSPVPAGANVALAFDGVEGPSTTTTASGGYRVDYGAAGSGCANRVGAAVSVVYGGVFYPTGHSVGDSPGGPLRADIAAP